MISLEKDLEAVKVAFPFIVTRLSRTDVELDIGKWLYSLDGDVIAISRKRIGFIWEKKSLVTYGFKKEEDATAFKLKFGI